MSAPIGVGDYVECVKRDDYFGIEVGSVWLVEELVHVDAPGCDFDPDCVAPALWFQNFPRNSCLAPCGCGFKPIYGGGELKRLLLEKPLEVSPPEKVKADA